MDRKHGQRGKQERKHGSNQDTRKNNGFTNIDRCTIGHGHSGKGRKEGKGRQDGGTNGKSLSSSGRGVTKSIQGIGSVTDTFFQFGHFGNTTGIVRHGSVGIGSQGDTQGTEHTNSGHGNTVLSRQSIATQNGGNKNQNGEDGGNHTDTQTLNDDSGRSGNTGFGNGLGRPKGVTSKVFGRLSNQDTGKKSNTDTSKDSPSFSTTGTGENKGHNECGKAHDQNTGDRSSLVQGHHQLTLIGTILGSHGKVSNHGGNDTRTGNPKGQ